ncbi:3-deoxy-D-manno-octulosonic acid transferase, partial [Candidatus Pelagibacter sp.]|nr:3-deoxy-D-manno-octulosonic acid transferase [Candidatus Pelagibacter sp.]
MLLIYRFLINLIFLFSPIIIFVRLLKKKESVKRFKEKFCIFSKKRGFGKLLWFHGASVGEIQSIIPLLEKFEKEKKINKILLTSNTLSSSKIIKKLKFKKVTHQFFPIDTNFFSKKFINYWKPSAAFFIDSEIWPNMITNLHKKKIPISLINARITKKTFNKWQIISSFSKNIFCKIDMSLPSNNISKYYLKKLGANKIKLIGNLKFSQSENEKISISNKIKKIITSRKTWCASSTHHGEEKLCGLAHIKLKKEHKNLLTIIIPRHVERTTSIKSELEKLDLKVQLHEPERIINSNVDIYIVNSYGKTKSFYSCCKNIFLGGSIINHGGQNPLEATRYGCNILHGPNIKNFEEIYKLLYKKKLSTKISNFNELSSQLNKLFKKNYNYKDKQNNLNKIGKIILKKTFNEI